MSLVEGTGSRRARHQRLGCGHLLVPRSNKTRPALGGFAAVIGIAILASAAFSTIFTTPLASLTLGGLLAGIGAIFLIGAIVLAAFHILIYKDPLYDQ